MSATLPDVMRTGQQVLVSIRPERIELKQTKTGMNSLAANVTDCVYQGDHLRVQLDGNGNSVIARLGRKSHEWPIGANVVAEFQSSDCWVIAS